MNAAQARAVIQAGNVAWGQARVAYDRSAFDSMLAPDFVVRLPDRMMTRSEFIDLISGHPPAVRLTRFDATVLTVQRIGDTWVALILERIERTRVGDGGEGDREPIIAVTRDGWKQEGDRWIILFSELLGEERWPPGNAPPLREW